MPELLLIRKGPSFRVFIYISGFYKSQVVGQSQPTYTENAKQSNHPSIYHTCVFIHTNSQRSHTSFYFGGMFRLENFQKLISPKGGRRYGPKEEVEEATADSTCLLAELIEDQEEANRSVSSSFARKELSHTLLQMMILKLQLLHARKSHHHHNLETPPENGNFPGSPHSLFQ